MARLRPLLEISHNKQRFITMRIPQTELNRISGHQQDRVEEIVFASEGCHLLACDLRQAPSLLCASVSPSVTGDDGGGNDDYLSLSGDESKMK